MSFRDDFRGAGFDSFKRKRIALAKERELRQKEKIRQVLQSAAARKAKEEEDRLGNNDAAGQSPQNAGEGERAEDEQLDQITKQFMLSGIAGGSSLSQKLSERWKNRHGAEAKPQGQTVVRAAAPQVTEERGTETRRSRSRSPTAGGGGETDRTSVEAEEEGPDVFRMRTNTINEILRNREMYISNYESKSSVPGRDGGPPVLDDMPQRMGNALPTETTPGVRPHGNMREETRASVVGNGGVAATTTATTAKSASKIIFEAVYAFAANGDRNMTNLVPGEKCIVIRKGKRGWWLVSKLLFQEDKGFVPSTYLKPCDEVYYVKGAGEKVVLDRIPEAASSILNDSSTLTVDGGALGAGKSDAGEARNIQSKVTSSSKAVATTKPKPLHAAKADSTTRPVATAKSTNEVATAKPKPSRAAKAESITRPVATGKRTNSRVANSLVHTPEVQRISLAISSGYGQESSPLVPLYTSGMRYFRVWQRPTCTR